MMTAVLLLAITVGVVGNVRRHEPGQYSDVFGQANFTEVREPLGVTRNTEHGELSVRYIEYINDNFYNRIPFSYQEMHTAVWLVEELLAMGYTWDEIEVQEFAWEDVNQYFTGGEVMDILIGTMNFLFRYSHSPFWNLGMRESRMSQNVVLTVPGESDEMIIVGAHYDTWFAAGASDNASGMALLLESAQRMLEQDNYYTIVYVFFGAEEAGVFGAQYFANSLTAVEHHNIKFMVNADILIEGPVLFYSAGYEAGEREQDMFDRLLAFDANWELGTNSLVDEFENIARRLNNEFDLELEPWHRGIFYVTSDHLAFLPWGHTVITLSGLERLDDWDYEAGINLGARLLEKTRVLHTPRDNFEHINETWPGKMEDNMRGFSIFLEEILLMGSSSRDNDVNGGVNYED